MSVTEFLQGLPVVARVLLGVLLFVLVALFEQQVETQASTVLFYLIPISFFTWFLSPWLGLAGSIAAVLVSLRWQSDGLAAYWNAVLHLGMFVFLTFILSQARSLYQREKRLSRHDFLTGVLNERAFHELLALEQNRARRYGYPMTLAYMDLDNFKEVNDRFGHAEGDAVLVALARTLRENIRQSDSVARLGGDEFGVLMPQTGEENANAVLQKLRAVATETMSRQRFPVTFSTGVVTFIQPPESAQELLERADQLMYDVKAAGKNSMKQEVVRG